MRARIAANEEKIVFDYEKLIKENSIRFRAEVERDVLAGMNRQAAQLRHRNYVVEELLTIKCPNRRCQLAFIMENDFDECFALSCTHCRINFCGWCLRNLKKADAHVHTTGCRSQSQEPKGLYPQNDNDKIYSAKQCFNQVHGPRRAKAVKDYLDAQNLHGADRDAVITAVEEQWNTGGVTLLGENIDLR